MIMGILSLAMLLLGWRMTKRPIRFLSMSFSERRLTWAAACLSVFGAVFYFLLSRLPGEVSIGVQMTGMPVVYLFSRSSCPTGWPSPSCVLHGVRRGLRWRSSF